MPANFFFPNAFIQFESGVNVPQILYMHIYIRIYNSLNIKEEVYRCYSSFIEGSR